MPLELALLLLVPPSTKLHVQQAVPLKHLPLEVLVMPPLQHLYLHPQ
jgi:hypothetical protein